MSRRPGHLEKQVAHAVKTAYWLSDADAAAVWTARALAQEIDDLHRTATPQTTLFDTVAQRASKVAYVAGQLTAMLDRLGLTSRGRMEIGFSMDRREENPLDDLRKRVVAGPWPVDGPSNAEDRDATNGSA